MAVAFCPECEFGIPLGKEPFIGQQVTCAECGAFLEVLDLSPIRLDWSFQEYDDEEDELEEMEYGEYD